MTIVMMVVSGRLNRRRAVQGFGALALTALGAPILTRDARGWFDELIDRLLLDVLC